MALDDVYKVTINGTGQGSIYQNVLHVQHKFAGDPSLADFNVFVLDWANNWTTYQPNSVTWSSWKATQQWGANMAIDAPRCVRLNGKVFAAAIVGTAGGLTGEMLPPQAAAVTTWLTGISGRRKRGRSYAFGLHENAQGDGVFSGTMLTFVRTQLTAFLAKYHATSGTSTIFRLGVWSERTASGCVPAGPPLGGHKPVDPPHPELAFTGVTGYTLRDIVFTQRRRTRGVGF